MKPNTCGSDWAAARGEKWVAQLAGLEAMLAPVDAPVIRALALDAPYRIADIGCGGGGTTGAILRHAPAGSAVHGYDISPASIAAARERVVDPAVEFSVADAATYVPAPYERLVSRFGVMFFDDPRGAFSNLARWLLPGGRFVFAVWGRPADNPWIASVIQAVNAVAELPSPAPDAPGPMRYAETGGLVELLAQGGFREIEVEDWQGELPVGGGLPTEGAVEFALASFSVASPVLESGGEKLATARRLLTELYSPHEAGGVVRMAARVHLVTGTR